jgi:outer membrane protein assembly factor BamB
VKAWRVLAGWLPAIVLVPVAVVAVVRVSGSPDAAAATREVFPAELGTTWVYAVADHEKPSGTRTSQVVDQNTMLGFGSDDVVEAVEITRDYTDYPGTGPRSTSSWFGTVADQVVQLGLVDETGSMQALDPMAPIYVLDPHEGARLDYDGAFGSTPLRLHTTVSEVGTVEVGGDTFDGCARWDSEATFASEGRPDVVVEAQEWTCPGYGTVRTVETNLAAGTEVSEELVEFHGAAGNWYADGAAPGAAEAEPVAGGAEAFDGHRSLAVPDGRLGSRLAWSDVRPSPPLFPVVTDGDVVVTAERDGQVMARSRDTGEPRWRVDLGQPVMATPQVAGDRILVADRTRRIWALSLADGHALWVRRLGDVASSSPSLTDAGILVATDDAVLTMLDLGDGTTEWELGLPSPARTPAAVEGDTAYVADVAGGVIAVDVEDGAVRWSRTIDDGIDQGPVLDAASSLVVVADRNGLVHAYSAADGDERWVGGTRGLDHPMSVGSGVVVTSGLNDRLVVLDLATGDRLWTRKVPGTDSASVDVGDEVVATTDKGRVVLLDARRGRVVDEWRLPFPVPDDTSRVDVTPALVGDDVVFSLSLVNGLGSGALFAYPVSRSPENAAVGVGLRLRFRAAPAVPNEEPVPVGDSVVMAGGPDLLRVPPDEASTTLTTTPSGLQLGAVAGDGTAYTRVGDQLQAIRVADGTVSWSVPAGAGNLQSQPAVDGDQVVVGSPDVGLLAVDRATGRTRWTAAVPDALSVARPVPLPGGDVLYAGGALSRYDGATGRPLWRADDTYLFGPPAVAGDTIVAQTVGAQAPAGIGGYDVATGEPRWFVEQPGIPSFLGPAVQDGVVVAVDTTNRVTARSAADGRELWSLQLHHGLSGQPVIADGRVLLVESGIAMGLTDPDYRVSVHDLRTGRYLGSWEPGVMPFQVVGVPRIGRTDDGHLLVPATGGLAEVVVSP